MRALVETFYDIIEHDPAAESPHAQHLQGAGVGHSLVGHSSGGHSSGGQFNYLCGFFGGPQHYVMRHGHARLRQIHAHVAFGPALRDLWLACMARAIAERGIKADLAAEMMRHFSVAAEVSRKRDGC